MDSSQPEAGGDAGAASSSLLPQDSSAMSKEIVGQLQATGQEGSAQGSQQGEQQHMNVADQLSQPELVTEGSKSENLGRPEHDNPQSQQEQSDSENQLQQSETSHFQFVEKEPAYVAQQNIVGSKMDIAQPSGNQHQHAQQISSQQAPAGSQDARRGKFQPTIPFNMLIPLLQAHIDRDKDMQLQTVWAKLRRNEVHKDDFLRVIRNIVGDQMLKQAANKVYTQIQVQAQRNNQTNPNQYSLLSQVSAQQFPSSGSRQLPDQQVPPPTPPNQGQKSQTPPSPQTFAPASSSQMQNSMGYPARDNQVQKPDAKGMHAMPNRPTSTSPMISLQTMNKQQHHIHPQASHQMYGTSNLHAHAYARPTSGSTTPLRPPSLESQMRPSPHIHGMVPVTIGAVPTQPALQQSNAFSWQMSQNKDLKTNAFPPTANVKQEVGDQLSESARKSHLVGLGSSSSAKLQGKQANPGPASSFSPMMHASQISGPHGTQTETSIQISPTTSAPFAGGSTKTTQKKPSGGQKKPFEAVGSTPPPSSKKQKTSGAFQDQSIDQLNDVTAVSGVNLREEEEQLLSAPKEESRVSEAARRVVQEEEEKMILQKGPLLKKLAEIIIRCNLKNISGDVERCLSMCVEERLRRLVSTLIRVSKQRIDIEKTGHQFVITSDVGRQILLMNRKIKEEWDKKQAEEAEKNRKQTETDSSNGAELDKDKDDGRSKNAKPNKEEDDKMRTTAANVAARQAVGGSDMLSKWQLMAEQARQKREGLDTASASQPGKAPVPRPGPKVGKGPREHQEAAKRGHPAAFGSGGMKRPGRSTFAAPRSKVRQRTISVKDVISVLEREPQMTKSRLIYRLYERVPGDSASD